MSGLELLVQFDGSSLRTVERFAEFEGFLDMRLYDAGMASLGRLEMEAYTYMWATFKNPQGNVEDSLGFEMETPQQGWMGTDSAYGRRLNYGFSGMTDALGRYYEEWPIGPYAGGYHWAEHAIVYSAADIVGYYKTALNQTVLDLGGTP